MQLFCQRFELVATASASNSLLVAGCLSPSTLRGEGWGEGERKNVGFEASPNAATYSLLIIAGVSDATCYSCVIASASEAISVLKKNVGLEAESSASGRFAGESKRKN